MATLLIPGRHLLASDFMDKYLESVLKTPFDQLAWVNGVAYHGEPITQIIFPITSANQHGSRFNPVPLYARIAGLERVTARFREQYNLHIVYVPVPHIQTTTNFANFILKQVAAESGVGLDINSTIVWTSTEALISQFADMGFPVLPAEWNMETATYWQLPPTQIIAQLVTAPWNSSNPAYSLVSEGTRSLWNDMPEIPQHIARLWNDPLLTDSGSLTDSRNYGVYTVGMGNHDVLDVKFNDIKSAIKEGKIVDEGCADGALMVKLAQTFPDSDIIGIDITGEFVSRVEERQRAGDFGNSFVHVYQRNILEPIFSENTIDSVICNSTLHEVWSYGDGAPSVRAYLKQKFTQLKPGGRLVIRDVVGPPQKDQTVFMKLNTTDGINAAIDDREIWKETPTKALSTQARFFRFADEFLRDMRDSGKRGENTKLVFTVVNRDGSTFIKLPLASAIEFLSRKDYHENWVSEMNEEFTFWDFEEWQQELTAASFSIAHDSAKPSAFSHTYRNEWIIKNRYEPSASLWIEEGGALVTYPFPVTTMVLVGEKSVVSEM
jgi:SAM-dependent methyltransferase